MQLFEQNNYNIIHLDDWYINTRIISIFILLRKLFILKFKYKL